MRENLAMLCIQECACTVRPALFSSLSYCLRCAIYHEMVVDKQCWYETNIVPAHKNNNIAVFTVRLAAYIIAFLPVPYAAKTWLQKKEVRRNEV